MNPVRVILAAAVMVGLLLIASLVAVSSRAQPYPPPVGSLTVAATSTTPSTGGTSTLTATVLDNSGNPVANADVVFEIVSQPGTDARFSNGQSSITAKTGANGVASAVLSAGSAPGNVLVKMIAGDKTSQVTLQVQGAPGAPATGGEPPSENSGGFSDWRALLLAAGALVLVGGGAVLIRRRRTV
ncbi:MAG TPA: hypothetical protein VFT91_02170 [Dehalococcoidia bacterium]|nr:hypothetical protein [Dehalococcoidia bacterium]